MIVCALTRTAAYNALRRIELPYQQFGTVHSFAYRALGQPVVAESKIAEWNEAYPNFALSGHGQPRTPDDGFVLPEDTLAADVSKLAYSRLRTTGVARSSPEWSFPGLKGFSARWEDWKAQNHYVDFTDMLEQCLADVDTAPGEPAVILVDEGQDVGRLEMQLLLKWAERAEHFALFADPGQSIFNWRGTSGLLVQELREKFDPARKILGQSYRLPQKVYDYAYTWQMRFRQTMRCEYLPRVDESGHTVQGFVQRGSLPFSRHTPESLEALVTPYLAQDKTVMFEATCGYMLEPVIQCLRKAGIPYGNPWRPNHGGWNPLPQKRSKGYTVVDRVLAFSLPRFDLWGEKARFWTAQEVKAWSAGLPSAGILTRGGQAQVQALRDDASDKEISDAFASWFTEEALRHIVPRPDIGWYMEKVKGADRLRDFVAEVIKRKGIAELEKRPRCIVGTVHSLKGSEADIVVLCPDLSLEALTAARQSADATEELRRVFYVGVTRAREGLILAESSSRNAVRW